MSCKVFLSIDGNNEQRLTDGKKGINRSGKINDVKIPARVREKLQHVVSNSVWAGGGGR